MLAKHFLASPADMVAAKKNIVEYQRYTHVFPLNINRATNIEKIMFLESLEARLRAKLILVKAAEAKAMTKPTVDPQVVQQEIVAQHGTEDSSTRIGEI